MPRDLVSKYNRFTNPPFRRATSLLLSRDPKPHLILIRGVWHLYRNAWKSQYPSAAAITGSTITELKIRLAKRWDSYRYGYPRNRL